MAIIEAVVYFVRAMLACQTDLALENVALRHQLAARQRHSRRPKLRTSDRALWVCIARLWNNWRPALVIVQAGTVAKWHRAGFRLFWRWKSKHNEVGRPKLDIEIRRLIRRMCRENPTWGAPKIRMELALLGYDVAKSTVERYMVRGLRPPSPTWRTFLKNHAHQIAAVDFFTVPTLTFRVLFCFIVLNHSRRRIVHFNVTDHPTAGWAAQQIIEAFPYDTAPRFLLRDRDNVYGDAFRDRVHGMGIDEVLIAPRSPWQNPYAERVIGSIRRECLDHVIIFGEEHLRRILREYVRYYNGSRPHLSLEGNSPIPREVEQPSSGKVRAIPFLGGLHHRYTRAA